MANINKILGLIDYIQGKKQQGRQAEARQSLSDFITESGGITGTVPGEETTPVTLPGAAPQRVGTTFGGKDIGFQTGGIPESTINVPEQIPVTQSPEFQKKYLDVAKDLGGPSFLNAIGSLGGITQPQAAGATEPYGYGQRRSTVSGEVSQVPVAPGKLTPFQVWKSRYPDEPISTWLRLSRKDKDKAASITIEDKWINRLSKRIPVTNFFGESMLTPEKTKEAWKFYNKEKPRLQRQGKNINFIETQMKALYGDPEAEALISKEKSPISKAEWLKKARKSNPGTSTRELSDYFDNKYETK